MKLVTDKLIRFFASVEWSLLLLRASLVFLLIFLIGYSGRGLSDQSAFEEFRRISDGFLPLHPNPWLLVVGSIFLLLILVHLVVVILIRNSAGGRHITLSIFQGALGAVILVAFFAILNYQRFTVQVAPAEEITFLTFPHDYELVIRNHSESDQDNVYTVDWKTLSPGKVVQNEDWGFHIRVNVSYRHAVFVNLLARKIDARGKQIYGVSATHGYAVEREIKMFSAVGNEQKDGPGLLIEIFDFDNESLGTFLLGCNASHPIPEQEFQISGRTWSVELRHQRFDPGFRWQFINNTETGPVLRFEGPDHDLADQPIGYFRSVLYNGFRFRVDPDLSENLERADAVRINVSRNPWGAILAITMLLTIAAALVHSSVWLKRREINE